MTLVSTVTVGAGGAAAIEFTGIAGTATDLLILLSERHSVDGNTRLTFNGSSSGYSMKRLSGTGSTVNSNEYLSGVFIYMEGQDNSYTASTFGNASIYIPNYAGSTNKSVSWDSVTENNNTTADQQIIAGVWANTAAITTVTLSLPSGVFTQYSTASLYTITKGSGGATVS
jgi:hypothetical protein